MATDSSERKEGPVVETEATANDVRVDFSDYVNRVVFGRERIIVTRHGKRVAALVSVEELERLQAVA